MAVNQYFNHLGHTPTQDMTNDLVVETIQFHGTDVQYIQRSLVNEDELYGEDIEAAFTTTDTVEMYLENVDGFGGDGDLMSKFGLDIKDTATFAVSKTRFTEETALNRPLEGDLIYLPLTKALLEVTFVETQDPFFQFGKQYVHKVKCELFEFNDEDFDTGIPAIDNEIAALEQSLQDVSNDPYADNTEIETAADVDIVFDPNDPWGAN